MVEIIVDQETMHCQNYQKLARQNLDYLVGQNQDYIHCLAIIGILFQSLFVRILALQKEVKWTHSDQALVTLLVNQILNYQTPSIQTPYQKLEMCQILIGQTQLIPIIPVVENLHYQNLAKIKVETLAKNLIKSLVKSIIIKEFVKAQ